MQAWTAPDGTLHEIYTGTLIAEGEFLGQFSYDSGQAAYKWDRSSLAYFCSHCGEIWGRMVATNSRGEQQLFRIIASSCVRHPDHWGVPGSFLRESFEGRLDELPSEALQREFQIHLNYFEKQND